MLTARLRAVADLVVGPSLADIGTDHAYLPIALLKEGILTSAIASDLNQGPLNLARENVEKENLEDRVSLRLGSGVLPLGEEKVETIVIAGMGGILIQDLLEEGRKICRRASRLVLQPMNARAELRAYLVGHGYEIVDERLAREGEKFYEILAAEPVDHQPFSDFDFELGRHLLKKDALSLAFLTHGIEKTQVILESLERSQDQETKEKFKERLNRLKEARACLSMEEK